VYTEFGEYPPLLQNLVTQGYYESSTMSLWLDPDLGPPDGPDSVPSGKVIFGGLDTSLFTGPLTTLPFTSYLDTTIPDTPETWSLALSALQFTHGGEESFVSNPAGESCVISTGASTPILTNDTLNALLAAFDQAVFNATTGLYQMPCVQRANSSNSLSFTFSDPHDIKTGCVEILEKKGTSATITIPAEEVIWPAARLNSDADKDTCAVAVSYGPVCHLGVTMVRHGYWVYDLGNKQISVANSVPGGTKSGKVEKIPAGGVKYLQL